jgi:hypothetical protein
MGEEDYRTDGKDGINGNRQRDIPFFPFFSVCSVIFFASF